jgi:teichuronic acid biosynthesis glycosyltransferase TuaG
MLGKVSIIIPYSKDRGWLDKANYSVLNQDYKGEIEIIESQSFNGVSYNLNRGIEKSTGEYIKYLCDDDMLTEWSISSSVEAIQGYDFIHGGAVIKFQETGGEVIFFPKDKHPTLESMVISNKIHGTTLMYRRDVFERVGLFREDLDCAEEYEFNLRCLKNGLKLNYCHDLLAIYRRHEKQKSLGNMDKAYQDARQTKIETIKSWYRK